MNKFIPLALCLLLPLSATAAQPKKTGIDAEISADMAEARKEVREELARARAELESENLDVGGSLHFGKAGKRDHDDKSLPKAEITPKGEFLIDGKPVATDAQQRRQLLAYRGRIIDIAKAGIDIGERSAQAALDAVDRGLFSLVFSAMSGGLERRIEKTVKEAVEPGVRQICRSLPGLLETQQQLVASLPQFRPYADLQTDDVKDCEKTVREEFANL
ncbi:MAG: hypothetical protein QM769_14775 [Pseudoxanthomonas sp.]